MDKQFWKGKRVFVTGHTGFKGAWLCLWLNLLGAKVSGYALTPPTNPSLFDLARVGEIMASNIGDVRDKEKLSAAIQTSDPEIIFHLAAQPIVRTSYQLPVETFDINVMGTVNVLEAARGLKNLKAFVDITTDKVYENLGNSQAYKESDPLGGYDPYASSKACSELVASAYRTSFNLPVATARAGNVIGGGDWAADRLIPDFVRSILKNEPIRIRNPKATRPWQFVLEPLSGYLTLAEKLYREPAKYAQAWNFGPKPSDAKPVEWIVKLLTKKWPGSKYEIDKGKHPHEAAFLKLNWSKAQKRLSWKPKLDLAEAIEWVLVWTRDFRDKKDLRATCLGQISKYANLK